MFLKQPFTEFEVQILKIKEDGEMTNVIEHVYKQVLESLQVGAIQGHLQSHGERQITDFFFENSIRLRSEIGVPGQIIKKTRMCSLQTVCDERSCMGFRFSLKKEQPMTKDLCEMQVPISVRIQNIHEFTYKNTFQYSLKIVKQGRTKQEACQQAPEFHIEIELLRESKYHQQNNPANVVRSFAFKALDMIGLAPQLTMRILHSKKDQEKNLVSKTRQTEKKKLKTESHAGIGI